jgi:hypothetical protein
MTVDVSGEGELDKELAILEARSPILVVIIMKNILNTNSE